MTGITSDIIIGLSKLSVKDIAKSSEMFKMNVLRNRGNGRIQTIDNQYMYWSSEDEGYISADQKREREDFFLYNAELKKMLLE